MFRFASWVGLTGLILTMADGTFPAHAANAPGASCKISATRNDQGARLSAQIIGAGPISGSYVFTVTSDGGDAVKSESGTFATEETARKVIKQSNVELPADAGYRATLQITWPDGSSSCSASVS